MPSASPAPLILSDVAYQVAGRVLLSGLTLTLSEMRIGIIGRNGSGKTTLLKLLAGLISPTSGLLRLGDIDPARDRKAALAGIGILFQNPDHQILFPTVEEELYFGLTQQGLSREAAQARVLTLLEAEGRSHWRHAATHQLSHGQRHYLCLLSVLLMAPGTLLLDEPFAGLDLPTQVRLARRLAALEQRLITISHDPASMRGVDRVLWLEAGHIRLDGAPGQVLPAFEAAMADLAARDADTGLLPGEYSEPGPAPC